METSKVSRRDFGRLTAAAVAGLAVGAAGCASKSKHASGDHMTHALLQEPHVCRGLNACKGKGAGGRNACAGAGECATVANHTCHAQNTCKGQGGCGEHPGENACKGKGSCAVPLSDKTWTKARANFEAAAKSAGVKFNPAPRNRPS